jgi:protein involved in temperature-dependent protein secretion
MEDLIAAVEAGDYARAYDALQRTPEAATPVGAAVGAFLLALIERFDEADQLVQSADLQGFEVIVHGERQRTARWRDLAAQGGFSAVAQSATAPLHAAMAVAFVQRDHALAERTKAELTKQTRPRAGQLTFADGKLKPFSNITDCDDAIGQMLETYCGDGLLYFPFEALQRVEVLPKTNFMDYLMPKVKLTTARGAIRAYVPLLYACSATSSIDTDRNGRITRFDYLGGGRRGLGQRDFMVDHALVGLQSIATIDFT